MALTTAECIQVFEDSRLRSDYFSGKTRQEAYRAGLAALREKLERENPQPLTLDEIRQMRGQPAYCPEENAWGIITMDKIGAWANKPFFSFFWLQDEDADCGVDCEWNIEERELTLYRYKPPEKGGGSDAQS